MNRCVHSRSLLIIAVCTMFSLLPILVVGQQAKSPFDSHDALRVSSLRVQAFSDDGRAAVGTISTRRDRLNVDHKRFGDPTYIQFRPGKLVLIDTETGEMRSLFKEKVHVQSPVWSPDGKTLAFFRFKDGRFVLCTYGRESGRVREIRIKTDKAIASNSMLQWTPDGSSLTMAFRETDWEKKSREMFLEATEGPIIVYDSQNPLLKWEEIRNRSGLHVIARVDLGTRSFTEILPEGRYFDFRQSEDGRFAIYVEVAPKKTDYSRKGGTDYALHLLGLQDTSLTRVLVPASEKRLRLSWNEENTAFAWSDSGHIFVRNVFDEKPVNLTRDRVEMREDDDTTTVKFSMEGWSPDGSKLLARSDKGFWLIDPNRGDIEMVYALPADDDKAPELRVQGWSPDGKMLYFTYSAKDKWERGLVGYDLESLSMTDLVKDTGLYTQWRLSKDGSRFVYQYSNGDLPSDLYTADRSFEAVSRLTNLNPWIEHKSLTHSELVKYMDTDGNELSGILYYPVDYDSTKTYPLVCEIYEQFFDNGFHTNMNLIANAGFFGFRPSVQLEKGYPGEAWIRGITSGINKLIERGIVDPDKLGVHGTSYGGYATSLLITQTDRFAAAINISGKTNIISFLGDSPRIGTRNYSAAEVGQDRIGATLWQAPLRYILHTAVMFADRVNTPHLLLTGQDDWNVPMASTREMYYALRRLGKECVWVDYVNAGHGAGRAGNEEQFHDMWKRMIEWYQTHFEEKDKKKDDH